MSDDITINITEPPDEVISVDLDFVYSQQDYDTWNSTSTQMLNLSGGWEDTRTNVGSASANWNSNYTQTKNLSGNWQNVTTKVRSSSANWDSGYNQVNSLSANWGNGGNTSISHSISSNWQSTYTQVSSLSTNWNDVTTRVMATSALSARSVVYVAKIGNDNNSGNSIYYPKQTIGSAVAAASAILVANPSLSGVRVDVLDGGEYVETWPVSTITIPTGVHLVAPAATFIGNFNIESLASVKINRHFARFSNHTMVTHAGGPNGPAIYEANISDGRGTGVTSLSGTRNVLNTAGSNKNLFVKTGIMYVATNGVGFGDIATSGHIHLNLADLYLAGDNAIGIQGGGNTANIIGFIDHILEIGTPATTTGISITNSSAIVKIVAAEILANTAYSVTAGNLYLVCPKINGLRVGTPISEISDQSANQWESTRTQVNTLSANWANATTKVIATSANWDSNYTTVQSTSANWELKGNFVNVKDYGAIGNGIVDDTSSFTRAVTASPAAVNMYKGDVTIPYPDTVKIYVPPGDYNITSLITTGGRKVVWELSQSAKITNYDYLNGKIVRAGDRISNSSPFGNQDNAVGLAIMSRTEDAEKGSEVLGLTNIRDLAWYYNRDSVTLYAENINSPLIGETSSGTYTATTVTVSPALSVDQVKKLVKGMVIDTKHSSKWSGLLSSWASNGSSLTVTGWVKYTGVRPITDRGAWGAGTSYVIGDYVTGNFGGVFEFVVKQNHTSTTIAADVASGKLDYITGIPGTGTGFRINPFSKIWSINTNVTLDPGGYATEATGIEVGVWNKLSDPINATSSPRTWGMDVVNLGPYRTSVGYVVRGDFFRGFEATGSQVTLFSIDAKDRDIVCIDANAAETFVLDAGAGRIELGNTDVAGTRVIDFRTSGRNDNDYDCRIRSVSGLNDNTGQGFMSLLAARVGVGTETPNERLTVFGNASASGNVLGNTGLFTTLSASGNVSGNTALFTTLSASGNVSGNNGLFTTLSATGNITTNAALAVGTFSGISWATHSLMSSPANGNIRITNAASSSFGLLQFGGTTNLFPALKRNGTGLQVRLADDTGNAPLSCANLTISPLSSVTPGNIGELTIEATSNTTLTFKLRGSDNTVRTGTLTLS